MMVTLGYIMAVVKNKNVGKAVFTSNSRFMAYTGI
jgi:hypothetical protein